MIHNFKGSASFTVIIKYWLCTPVVQYILVSYFLPNSLQLLILYCYIAPPHLPFPTGNHNFVLYICESASSLVYSLVGSVFGSSFKWCHIVFVFLLLTYFT